MDIAAVLPEQRALWFRAAQVQRVSFSSFAREALDAAALEILRDSKQHIAQAAMREAGAST